MTETEIITLVGKRITNLATQEMELRDQLSQSNPWDKYKIKVLAAKHNGCIDRRQELESLLDEIIDVAGTASKASETSKEQRDGGELNHGN